MELPLLLEILRKILPGIVGLFLTFSILLYLFFGDNALFRLVSYFFIGVVAGYMLVLIIFQVLIPRFRAMIQSGEPRFLIGAAVLLVLGILTFFKLFPRLSRFGAIPMAILVGIGAAIAIGGAVFGTLSGQIAGTLALFRVGEEGGNLLAGGYVLVGAVSTLAYFQFTTRSKPGTPVVDEETTAPRATFMELLAKVGQIFIGITLGAMFAGVYTAAITAMVERLIFIFETLFNLLEIAKTL